MLGASDGATAEGGSIDTAVEAGSVAAFFDGPHPQTRYAITIPMVNRKTMISMILVVLFII